MTNWTAGTLPPELVALHDAPGGTSLRGLAGILNEYDQVCVSARSGGKRKALDEAIAARLREGWTEVTGDPEFAPRIEGVRLFVRPERDDEPGPAAVYGGDLAPPLCCCKAGSMCAECGTGRHGRCPDRDDDDWDDDDWDDDDWDDHYADEDDDD